MEEKKKKRNEIGIDRRAVLIVLWRGFFLIAYTLTPLFQFVFN